MNQTELEEVLDSHKRYLSHFKDGEKADLRNIDLRGNDLSCTELQHADLRDANLRCVNLKHSDLRGAKLQGANLNSALLEHTNLSNVSGLISQSDWIDSWLTSTNEGIICYKQFGNCYNVPDYWEIKSGSVLEEVVNPCRTLECGCGISVAKRDWIGFTTSKPIWKCLIRWKWIAGVVIPYNTDGKFRTEKAELLESIDGNG